MADDKTNLPDKQRGNGITLVPGIARIAASVGWHATSWAVGTYVKAGRRVVGVIVAPQTGVELAEEVIGTANRVVRGVVALAQTGDVAAVAEKIAHGEEVAVTDNHKPPRTLREEGEQLLRQSRDVRYESRAHPAYERILGELAPDEGRVLRLMVLKGPQPSVDIRTGGPLGMVNSHLIAGGLSMIGPRAGVRYLDRIPQYLNNLQRLGLVWFSRETIRDHKRYQVLEAQPDVLEAMHQVRSAKVVRRSVHLTPFGEDFCRVCLLDDATPQELADLPEHSSPSEDEPAAPKETIEG